MPKKELSRIAKRMLAWLDLRNRVNPAIEAVMEGWKPGDQHRVDIFRDGYKIMVSIERLTNGGQDIREGE